MVNLPDGTPLLNIADLLKLPHGKGLEPRETHPLYAAYGSVPWLARGEDVLPEKIPRSEWKNRIDDMWAKEEWPMCFCDFPCRSQDQTSSCWANGPCTSVDIKRRQQGLPFVETSAASIVWPVKGRDVGGWGIDAVNFLQAKGACSSLIWPNAAISGKYDTPQAEADRPHRHVAEFIDVPKNDFDYLATFLMSSFACPVGYDWWSHEVCAVALKLLGTGAAAFPFSAPDVAVVIRNSWQNAKWGYEYKGFIGYGNLDESKGTPNDCQAIREVISYAA